MEWVEEEVEGEETKLMNRDNCSTAKAKRERG